MNNRILPLPVLALTLLASCFCTTKLHAQSISAPGYYLTLAGDTVRGVFPNYKQWSRNPAQVQFIPAAASQSIELTPANSLKFSVDNEDSYIAYTGPRMINPIDDEVVINSSGLVSGDDQFDSTTTFLRLVAEAAGRELYVLMDANRVNFFYALPGEPVTELKYKKYLVNSQVVGVPVYQQQLLLLFPSEIEARKLTAALEKLRYVEDDIVRFFKRLDPKARPGKSAQKGAAGWVVSAGISVNPLKVNVDQRLEGTQRDYSTSVSPVLSVGYLLPLNRHFGRYFVYPQARLFRYKHTGELVHRYYVETSTYETNLAALGELNVGAHLVNRESFKFHLSAGVGMAFFHGNKATDERVYPPAEWVTTTKTNLKKMSHVANLSTGVLLKNKVLVQATYNMPVNIGDFVYYSVMQYGYQLRVGYKLK